jgi:tetratricopeptide (TPR) repeat protein
VLTRAFLFIFILLSSALKSQDAYVDSLKLALKNTKQDTLRCIILIQLAENGSDEEWHLYNDTLFRFCESRLKTIKASTPLHKTYLYYYGIALNNKGYFSDYNGNQTEAIDFYKRAIKIREDIDDKKGLASSYNNIGYIFKSQGNIPLAIDYYTKSIRLQEQNRKTNGEPVDKKGLAYSYSNLGVIYKDNGDLEKALVLYNKSLKLREEINDKLGMGHSLNNIGFIYEQSSKLDKALEYFEKSLKLREETGYKNDIANSLHNVAFAYEKKGDREKAFQYYQRCISLQEATNDKYGLSYSYNNLAAIYLQKGKISEALNYSLRGVKLAKELGNPGSISHGTKILSRVYKAKGNAKEALEVYKLYVTMHDSVNNENNRKASVKSQLKYDYEKKAAADSVRVVEERKVVDAQLKQEKTQRYALSGGLVMVVLFALFMVNRFRVTNKQKKVIEEQKGIVEKQKEIVEEKQKEVLDSIHYAKRIQLSLLPQEKYIDKILKGNAKK